MMATNSPFRTARFAPRSACTSVLPTRKVFLTSTASRTGPPLLILQRLYGVLVGRLQSGIEGAGHAAQDREQSGCQQPERVELHHQRSPRHDEPSRDESHDQAEREAEKGKDERLAFDHPEDEAPRTSHRLQNADLARSLRDRGIEREKDGEPTDGDREGYH